MNEPETWCGVPLNQFLLSHPLHYKQALFVKAAVSGKYRIVGAITGIQFGKSISSQIAMAIIVIMNWLLPYAAYISAAPSFKIMEGGMMQSFKRVFDPLKLGTYNKNDKVFYFTNGHRDYFRSMDASNALEGITDVRAAVGDEAGLYAQSGWVNFQARCSPNQATMLLVTNAYNIGWLLKDVWRPYSDGQVLEFMDGGQKRKYEARKYMYILQGTSDENPGFGEDLAMQRRRMGEDEYQRKYTGTFKQMTGLVYQDFDVDKHVLPVNKWSRTFGLPYPRIPHDWRLSAGVDWGHKDPFAVVVTAWGPDGTSVQVDEILKHHLSAENMVDELEQLQEKWDGRIEVFHCDHDPKMIQYACSRRLNAVNADKSVRVRYGISQFKSLIRTKRRYVLEYCEFSIVSLQTYHEREQKNPDAAPHENPSHLMSDLPDAMRYDMLGNMDLSTSVELHPPRAPDDTAQPWEQSEDQKCHSSAAERIKRVTQKSSQSKEFMSA